MSSSSHAELDPQLDVDQHVDCPVLLSWLKLDGLVARAATGKIADVSVLPLTRETVADNAEVLEPVLREFGSFA